MRSWVGITVSVIATQSLADIPADVEANFRGWLDAQSIDIATLALMQNGALVHEFGVGIASGSTREMASLSKAITGVCVMSLIDDGLWSYDTKVSEVLENGPRISVKQLLTHSSGLTTDSTQVSMRSQLDNPDRKTDLKAIFERGAEGPAGGFVYNNENYAILGAMIEAETSQSYQKTCSKRALAPAGVQAKLSIRAGAFDAFGGWAMNSADDAKFFHFHLGPSTDAAKSALNLPKIKAGNAVYYGPGVTFRQWGEGANFWHFGALCFPRRLNVGSFAVQFDIGWTLVATYDGCVDWPAMGQLDRVMADAIFERQ